MLHALLNHNAVYSLPVPVRYEDLTCRLQRDTEDTELKGHKPKTVIITILMYLFQLNK